jgi:hypothetical protein
MFVKSRIYNSKSFKIEIILLVFQFAIISCKSGKIISFDRVDNQVEAINICEVDLKGVLLETSFDSIFKMQIITIDTTKINLSSHYEIDSFLQFTTFDFKEISEVFLITSLKSDTSFVLKKIVCIDRKIDFFSNLINDICIDTLNNCNLTNKILLGVFDMPCKIEINDGESVKHKGNYKKNEPIIVNDHIFKYSKSLNINLIFEINSFFYRVNILKCN